MKENIDSLILKIEDHEARIKKLENMLSENKSNLKNSSIRDFMLSKKPSDDVKRTLVIGYYLIKNENKNSFNVDDILNGFYDSSETPPKRKKIYDKIKANVDKKYMMVDKVEDSKKKKWKLTNQGFRYVDNDFKKFKE